MNRDFISTTVTTDEPIWRKKAMRVLIEQHYPAWEAVNGKPLRHGPMTAAEQIERYTKSTPHAMFKQWNTEKQKQRQSQPGGLDVEREGETESRDQAEERRDDVAV